MKGLLLDTEENQIRKVEVSELHDYYKAMHCDCITVVYTELDGQQLAIICDDEALCKSGCLIPTVKLSSDDTIFNSVISDCRQSPRLFAGDFSVLKRLKVSIFKTFQSLFGIIKVSKKAVLFYDDTRNRKSKKANADGMY